MGRIPDNTYQLEDGTKILQWRWDTSYIDPGMPPMYKRFGGWGWGWGGGMWVPMGGFPPTLVRQSCIVEWTLVVGLGARLSLAGRRLPEGDAIKMPAGRLAAEAAGRHHSSDAAAAYQ